MVVGYPDKSLGWIMSRDREMSEGLYTQILSELVKKFDYNKDSFEKVIQHK
jgi:lipocalin